MIGERKNLYFKNNFKRNTTYILSMTSSNTNAMIALGFFIFTMFGVFIGIRYCVYKLISRPKEARYLLAS